MKGSPTYSRALARRQFWDAIREALDQENQADKEEEEEEEEEEEQ